jgi:hypothetical protein
VSCAYVMQMTHAWLDEEVLASYESMPFNDRPYFRRLLDFDDLVRRGRPVTCESLAERWATSTKTVQRFVDQIRADFGAPVVFDRKKHSFVYEDPSWRFPFLGSPAPKDRWRCCGGWAGRRPRERVTHRTSSGTSTDRFRAPMRPG